MTVHIIQVQTTSFLQNLHFATRGDINYLYVAPIRIVIPVLFTIPHTKIEYIDYFVQSPPTIQAFQSRDLPSFSSNFVAFW